MKIYVAARFHKKEDVRALYEILKHKGHTITHDWTIHENIRPYKENKKRSEQFANWDIQAVVESDVLIVLCDDASGGKGMHTELGAAIASQIHTQKPKIFVVGEDCEEALFYFHPHVIRKKNINDVLEMIK